MIEFSIETVEFTTYYSVYIGFLLSLAISVVIWLSINAPFIDSPPGKGPSILSSSTSISIHKKAVSIDKRILMLKKIRMKIASTDDEKAVHFSPNTKTKLEEKNEIIYKNTIHYFFTNSFSRLSTSC